MKSVRQSLVASTVLSLAAVGLFSGVAASPALAARAPSCVSTVTDIVGPYKHFVAYNGCNSTQRIKFIVNFGLDSPCYTLAPDEGKGFLSPLATTLDRIDSC
ncbi:hypothetical protein [Micromonospora sp. RP3T]|uniref:hypothetical protein n=1 Tax=Micromonospora sp. RP3T TaxID=2135446 RepID=UPI000D16AEA3|nr:hypothetical protein [Micromonospora sp. RP3T]PTA42949.1 hypothetical protein C8054_27970 [Micromonospora sp. RP3T]